jgi:hypothetical protein
MDASRLLPQTRGEAMANLANNKPVGTTRAAAFQRVSPNAAAAWLHMGGPRIVRFAWDAPHPVGPKATLLYVSNGPDYFARLWVRLVVHQAVAKCRLLASLPPDVMRWILEELCSVHSPPRVRVKGQPIGLARLA